MHIRSATRQDLPDMATVAANAMMKDELSLWLSPEQAKFPHVHRERFLRGIIRRWNTGRIMLVMVTDDEDNEWDGSPKIIAYAAYEKEVGASDDSSKTRKTIFDALERFLYRVEANYIYYLRNDHNTVGSRAKHCFDAVSAITVFQKYERFWELDFLAVDPVFGRRGIGAQFIDWVQQRAVEDGVPVVLGASYQGKALYMRKEFKEVGKLSFSEGVAHPLMVWEPPPMGYDET